MSKSEKMKKLRRSIRKLRKRFLVVKSNVTNSVKDQQQKAIHYYCENYRHILLPDFDSVGIAKKLKKQGIKKQARKTIELSHRSLLMRLRNKVEIYEHRRFYLVKEPFTSKTCGSCGKLNNVGCGRVYKCSKCDYEADRDLNAARNILIRTLSQ